MPSVVDDKQAIEQFLSEHNGKPIVAIQGLGFVGAVMALVCANAHGKEYCVIGVDRLSKESYWRIISLNEGVFPLIAEDPKIEEYFKNSRGQGNFYATFDTEAYAYADTIIVDINLDVDKESGDFGTLTGYEVTLDGFRKAIQAIGEKCKEDVLVLVETTVPPGTCQKIVRPILEDCLKARSLKTDKIRLAHSYERVMPGPQYIDSIKNFPRVYSGVNTESADAAEQFLNTIIDTEKCTLTRLESTNATEMAKVLENSYRAMNIAFIVEWSRFAEEAGVNLYEVVRAIRNRPTHTNIMLPGIGVGGYCLTKDPLLASWSRQKLFGSPTGLSMSEISVATNDKMPDFAYRFLERQFGSLAGKSILLLGVSYRGDVGDTRFSPVDLFYECLIHAGAELDLHDPYVSYWAEKERVVEQDLGKAINKAHHIVVLSAGHSLYTKNETVNMLMDCDTMTVYDTIGAYSPDQIKILSTKHSVKVLGRGDL